MKNIIIIFSFAITILYFTGCENPNDPNNNNIGNPVTPIDKGTSTWMYSNDIGATWFVYKLGYASSLNCVGTLNSVPYTSVLAVGTGGVIIQSVDGGGTFTIDTMATKSDLNYFTGNGLDLSGIAVGNNGVILTTSDDALNWQPITSNTTSDLLSVKIESFSGTGFAVGKNQTIIRTENRGLNWSGVQSGSNSITYSGICFVNQFVAIVVGDSSSTGKPIVLYTLDAGLTWQPATIPVLNNIKLNSVSFLDTLNGITVGTGGTILKTTDAGLTWVQKFPSVITDLYSVLFDAEVCMIAGNKSILRSFDLGETWSASPIDSANGKLKSIYKIDAGNYFVSGE